MDYYDKAVAYLTEKPSEIFEAWANPTIHPAGLLFTYTDMDRSGDHQYCGKWCGCLTMIRRQPSQYAAPIDSLNEAILADNGIPRKPEDIDVEDLATFAEWQRRIDAELGRIPPVWTEPEPAQ